MFTGPLYGEEKNEAYIDAALHVLPRSWEPFGLILLEASACEFVDKVGCVTEYDKEKLYYSIYKIITDDDVMSLEARQNIFNE